jgi:ACS family tartrate transporter-like MFS transporter
MFVLEGVPAIALGILTLFVLPDGPAQARWLSAREKHWLGEALDQENAIKASHGTSFWQGLRHPRVLSLAAIYFAISFGVYGLSLWMPTIVDRFGGLDSVHVGLWVMVPYAVAVPAVYVWTRSADRRQERVWHTAVPMLVAGLSMIVSAYAIGVSPLLSLAALTVVACGLYAGLSPFWELPASLMTGATAAAGFAAINSIGSLAGFAAPYAVGLLRDATGDNRIGLLLLAGVLIAGGLFCLWYGLRHRLGVVVQR